MDSFWRILGFNNESNCNDISNANNLDAADQPIEEAIRISSRPHGNLRKNLFFWIYFVDLLKIAGVGFGLIIVYSID